MDAQKEHTVNSVTQNLPQYPMEELNKIKNDLISKQIEVYDFGTGDPKVPIHPTFCQAIRDSVPPISQYPSILGTKDLQNSQSEYLQRRLSVKEMMTLPTRGSKEGIFHIALSLIERESKRRRVIYPNPGYPVYRSSILFAGGIPHPVELNDANNYLIKPWDLSATIIKETKAIWVNYPHNPTGVTASKAYWEKLVDFCREKNITILSDECYIDIYDENEDLPFSPLQLTDENVLSFFSLSKRSGFTGIRAGFIAGDENILTLHKKARANFGLAMPQFIQAGAVAAWKDDAHVKERRKIFSERKTIVTQKLEQLGVKFLYPKATFYIWCEVPKNYSGDDISFSLDLAEKGVIVTPSSWLSENVKQFFRIALVPDLESTSRALKILGDFINELK